MTLGHVATFPACESIRVVWNRTSNSKEEYDLYRRPPNCCAEALDCRVVPLRLIRPYKLEHSVLSCILWPLPRLQHYRIRDSRSFIASPRNHMSTKE